MVSIFFDPWTSDTYIQSMDVTWFAYRFAPCFCTCPYNRHRHRLLQPKGHQDLGLVRWFLTRLWQCCPSSQYLSRIGRDSISVSEAHFQSQLLHDVAVVWPIASTEANLTIIYGTSAWYRDSSCSSLLNNHYVMESKARDFFLAQVFLLKILFASFFHRWMATGEDFCASRFSWGLTDLKPFEFLETMRIPRRFLWGQSSRPGN